jgi:hypothetical protein
MKTLITLLVLGMATLHPVLSQKNFYNFSIYTGYTPGQTPYQAGTILNRKDPMNEFVFNLNEIEKSYVIGFRKNFRFSYPFFGTLGLEYTTLTQNYSGKFTQYIVDDHDEFNVKVRSQVVSLPAGVGVKFGNFDVTNGLMLQYDIKPELSQDMPMGIEMAKSQLEVGWFAGIGYSFDKVRVGVQYQSSLKRCGHNIMYQDKSMELMNVPGYLRLTVGYSF